MSPEALLAGEEDTSSNHVLTANAKMLPDVPSAKAQSWGVVISIVVIVLMITIGAFYAWGQRVAQNNAFVQSAASE